MKNKISIARVIIAGVLYAVISQVIHTIGAAIGMKYYLMEEYFPVWSKIMMPSAGPPPASFMVYGAVFAIITGLLLALVYSTIRRGIPGKSLISKGMTYGVLLYFVAGIPASLMLYMLINLPQALIISWNIESLLIYLLGGIVIAEINK